MVLIIRSSRSEYLGEILRVDRTDGRWTCSCKSEEGPEVEGRFGLSAIAIKLDEWQLRRFMLIRGSRTIGLALQ